MKKYVLLIFYSTIISICAYSQAMNQLKMEEKYNLYKQDLGKISLTFECYDSDNSDIAVYTTYIHNRKHNIDLPIDTIKYDKTKTNWRHAKKIGEGAPFCVDIIKAFLHEKTLYIFYSRWGLVTLTRYTFTGENNFTKNIFLIDRFFAIGALDGLQHEADFHAYQDNIYMYVKAGQHYGNRLLPHLCCFDTKNDSLTEYITVNAQPLIIPDEKRIFREMDFEKPDSYMKISKAIESVLVGNGKIKPNPKFTFKYLWCFDFDNYYRYKGGAVRDTGITYFFYQEDYPYSKVKVIRYDNDEFTWLLDEYKEQIIESVK